MRTILVSSWSKRDRGGRDSHGPNDISYEETDSSSLESGCQSETGSGLLYDRLTEDVASDGDPNDWHDIPSRHGEDFEVRWSEQASGSRNVSMRSHNRVSRANRMERVRRERT